MYSVGELIFYGKTGVCKIETISRQCSAATGEEQDFYILKPLFQEYKISIPVDNESVFMRNIVSKETALSIIEGIGGIDAKAFYCHNLNQLKEHYRDILNTHECERLIELIISVSLKRIEALSNKKKLGAVDERFLKEAEELLYGEFSAAMEISKAEVQLIIEEKIKNIIG